MQNTKMQKTSFTGQEFMNLFFKKETPKPISSKPTLTKLQMKISANLGYPGLFRNEKDNKPALTIRREHN
jgi:hypothetical protein